jgi:inner membrane protein
MSTPDFRGDYPATVWSFLLVSLLSHSLLDSLTTGGKGVGWLWPWRDERFFALWQVIRVAPFKLEAYLTARGEAVILSELYWVWLPGVVLMRVLILLRPIVANRYLQHQSSR